MWVIHASINRATTNDQNQTFKLASSSTIPVLCAKKTFSGLEFYALMNTYKCYRSFIWMVLWIICCKLRMDSKCWCYNQLISSPQNKPIVWLNCNFIITYCHGVCINLTTVQLKGNIAIARYCFTPFSKTIHLILDTHQRSLTVYQVLITRTGLAIYPSITRSITRSKTHLRDDSITVHASNLNLKQ